MLVSSSSDSHPEFGSGVPTELMFHSYPSAAQCEEGGTKRKEAMHLYRLILALLCAGKVWG